MAYNTVSDTDSLVGLAREMYPIDEIKKLEQLDTNYLKEVEEARNLQFSPSNDGSFIFPVKASGAHGQKMINQKEAIGSGKPSDVRQGRAVVKEYVGVIEITKRELQLAKKAPGVFANAKTFEMESLMTNAGKYFNRQIANGDGTGTITLVSGAQVAQTQVEVDDATPLQIGMVLDIYDAAGTTKQADGVVVVDIDIFSSPHSFTVSSADAVTCDDDGIICLKGVRDNAPTDGKEMTGLPMVVDDGSLNTSFQGLVRSGADEVPNYRGITLSASNAPLSVALLAQLLSRGYRVSGTDLGQSNDVYVLLSPEQMRAYVSLGLQQFRFMPGDKSDLGKAHTEAPAIMGKRAVIDTDVSRTRVYFHKKSAAKMAVAHELDWEDEFNGTALKWLSGYMQGVLCLYALQQYFSESPREVIALTDLATVAI